MKFSINLHIGLTHVLFNDESGSLQVMLIVKGIGTKGCRGEGKNGGESRPASVYFLFYYFTFMYSIKSQINRQKE